MKKYLILVFACSLSFAQDKLNDIKLEIDNESVFFEIADAKSRELLLYKKEINTTTILKMNDKFDVIDSLHFNTPNIEIFKNYLGHSKKNDIYSVYWSNKKRDSICYQEINFNADILKSKTFSIDYKKEVFLKSINIGSCLYIITIPKNGNSLSFHEFNQNEYKKNTVNFEGATFFHSGNKNSNSIYDVFNDGYLGVREISSEIPISLPLTQDNKKVYNLNDKDIVFTFDGNTSFTQILTINILDFSYVLKTIQKPFILKTEENQNFIQSNSIICNDKLFQIISSDETIIIEAKNFNSETLKSFVIEPEKEIDFLNSDIIQENLTVNNKRILDKSTQLVRKLNNLNLGLTCEFNDNKYNLTFGGFSDVQNNAMIYGGMFGIAGVLLATALTPSYSLQNINSYSGRRVVYVKSILDDNLNHVKGDVKESAFDNLRLFIYENSKFRNQIVFKFDKKIYFGGYDKKSKLFSFYSFID